MAEDDKLKDLEDAIVALIGVLNSKGWHLPPETGGKALQRIRTRVEERKRERDRS